MGYSRIEHNHNNYYVDSLSCLFVLYFYLCSSGYNISFKELTDVFTSLFCSFSGHWMAF